MDFIGSSIDNLTASARETVAGVFETLQPPELASTLSFVAQSIVLARRSALETDRTSNLASADETHFLDAVAADVIEFPASTSDYSLPHQPRITEDDHGIAA